MQGWRDDVVQGARIKFTDSSQVCACGDVQVPRAVNVAVCVACHDALCFESMFHAFS